MNKSRTACLSLSWRFCCLALNVIEMEVEAKDDSKTNGKLKAEIIQSIFRSYILA